MKRITTGSGITARTIELQPFTREAMRAWIDDTFNGANDFEGCVAAIEAWALPIDQARKARGARVGAHDTPEGYARRLLQFIGAVRRFIAEGDAPRAARFAVQLGITFQEMLMKLEWERPALVGVGRTRSAKRATALRETQRIIRVALAAELWEETATEARSRLWKVRVPLLADWMGIGDGTAETYLSEARAHGLIAD